MRRDRASTPSVFSWPGAIRPAKHTHKHTRTPKHTHSISRSTGCVRRFLLVGQSMPASLDDDVIRDGEALSSRPFRNAGRAGRQLSLCGTPEKSSYRQMSLSERSSIRVEEIIPAARVAIQVLRTNAFTPSTKLTLTKCSFCSRSQLICVEYFPFQTMEVGDFTSTVACFMRLTWAAAAGRLDLVGSPQPIRETHSSLLPQGVRTRVSSTGDTDHTFYCSCSPQGV